MSRTHIPADLRRLVRQRAQDRCEYCLLPEAVSFAVHEVDHVVAEKHGGPTEAGNLALSCAVCNARKWTHVEAPDPISGAVLPLYNPRTQVWSEHFRWSPADPVTVEALTPTGRATVALLDLNSPQHLTVRRWLTRIGQHPPA